MNRAASSSIYWNDILSSNGKGGDAPGRIWDFSVSTSLIAWHMYLCIKWPHHPVHRTFSYNLRREWNTKSGGREKKNISRRWLPFSLASLRDRVYLCTRTCEVAQQPALYVHHQLFIPSIALTSTDFPLFGATSFKRGSLCSLHSLFNHCFASCIFFYSSPTPSLLFFF